MSTFTFHLLNTTCTSTVLQLSKVGRDEAAKIGEQTLDSIPTSAKIMVGDFDYTFLLSDEASTGERVSQDNIFESTITLSESLTFDPPLRLENNTYPFSIILTTALTNVSTITEIELQGCDSALGESQETNGSTADNNDTQTNELNSVSSIEASQTGDFESATSSLSSAYTDVVTQSWSFEDALETTISTAEPTLAAQKSTLSNDEISEYNEKEEKKTIESGASAGGLILFLMIICLAGALYYRRLKQKKRREQAESMRDVWRSDMEEA